MALGTVAQKGGQRGSIMARTLSTSTSGPNTSDSGSLLCGVPATGINCHRTGTHHCQHCDGVCRDSTRDVAPARPRVSWSGCHKAGRVSKDPQGEMVGRGVTLAWLARGPGSVDRERNVGALLGDKVLDRSGIVVAEIKQLNEDPEALELPLRSACISTRCLPGFLELQGGAKMIGQASKIGNGRSMSQEAGWSCDPGTRAKPHGEDTFCWGGASVQAAVLA